MIRFVNHELKVHSLKSLAATIWLSTFSSQLLAQATERSV